MRVMHTKNQAYTQSWFGVDSVNGHIEIIKLIMQTHKYNIYVLIVSSITYIVL